MLYKCIIMIMRKPLMPHQDLRIVCKVSLYFKLQIVMIIEDMNNSLSNLKNREQEKHKQEVVRQQNTDPSPAVIKKPSKGTLYT